MTREPRRIESEAARWAVRLDGGPLEPTEQQELDAWLEADVRHRGALIRAQAAWLDLDRLSALAGHGGRPGDSKQSASPISSVQRRRWFLAASISSVALAGSVSWWSSRRRGDVYTSEIGEVRRVTLPDGSNMVLNTSSRAVAHFSPDLRRVVLSEGEALFEVMKDAARAFVVEAGLVSVKAVGTAFTVKALDRRVDVTVTEGVVEVAEAGEAGFPSHRVSADEQAVITKVQGLRVRTLVPTELERHLAWRDGMLAFDGEPLSVAVEEINRHNHEQITIDDPVLAARPVVGVFRASDPEGFAMTVATAFDARAMKSSDGIHLRRAGTP